MSGVGIRAGRVLVAGAVAVATLAPSAPSALSYARPGRTDRVSVAAGVEGNGASNYPSGSADGRYVAFYSFASNLVPEDTNGAWDVFVHERETGATERVSVASDGTQANNFSFVPSISADGSYVAFYSHASNLVPGDTNGTSDVFVHERATGATERVSVASDGAQGNAHSVSAAVSADGRYVAFLSDASNLVPGDIGGVRDVFVHDRPTGATERVSVGIGLAEADGHSFSQSVSADGRYVAFSSSASNLVAGDANGTSDVFVRDREAGRTELLSTASDGTPSGGTSENPSMSAGGRFVAFYSSASNLVPGDTNGASDVFVHDRVTGATERVSVGADGAQGNSESNFPSVSADGRYVAFYSFASNLVPGDTNGTSDVFVRDRGRPVGAGRVSAALQGERISVSGWATFSGQAVASATDPPGGNVPGAGPAGGDLTGASLTYRPEDEDLLLRLDLASLPGPLVGGAPAVLYGLGFDLGGVRYEVHALRAAATAVPPAAPYFALYRCSAGCSEQALLSGGIGTTGAQVVVSVPLSVLGASEGAALSRVQAFTSLGVASGTVQTLDQADLPDATIPTRSVMLGMAPAGTPEEGVGFDVPATLSDENFSGTLDVSSLPPGDYDVWARACLGEDCGAVSVRWMRAEGG